MLRAHGEPGAVSRAARAARELLGALAGGQLLARFEAIRGHVVARELPVLLPAGEDDVALAFVAGAVDLVYRDPDSDELVIVDYKTDVLEGDAALEARGWASNTRPASISGSWPPIAASLRRPRPSPQGRRSST
jgi:hypothetical protein